MTLLVVYLNKSSTVAVTKSSVYIREGDSTGVRNVGVEQLLLTGFADTDTGSADDNTGSMDSADMESVCPGAVNEKQDKQAFY